MKQLSPLRRTCNHPESEEMKEFCGMLVELRKREAITEEQLRKICTAEEYDHVKMEISMSMRKSGAPFGGKR